MVRNLPAGRIHSLNSSLVDLSKNRSLTDSLFKTLTCLPFSLDKIQSLLYDL